MDSFLNALGKRVYSHDFGVLFDRLKSIKIEPLAQSGHGAESGAQRISVRPSQENAALDPQFRWNAVAKEVMQEMLHQSRDSGQFSDEELDTAALKLLSGQDLTNANAEMDTRGYKAGIVGHRTAGWNCHATNPHGPPPTKN